MTLSLREAESLILWSRRKDTPVRSHEILCYEVAERMLVYNEHRAERHKTLDERLVC